MKKLITESDVKNNLKQGLNVIVTGKNSIITPLALDLIKFNKMTIVEKKTDDEINLNTTSQEHSKNKISIGSDHTGFRLKNILIKYLGENGFDTFDAGTYDEKPCDYPDFAKIVAESVSSGKSGFGILIDATGIPSAITANKVKGIRAATCYNSFSAKSSREHNDANILVVGAKALGEETIKSIVDVWLNTGFAGGRHQKRLDKINAIEKEQNE
ncbi:MAG TPA: ribose 5-phosphate isomerase B [Ignavibacteriaceae bacterium]|nr:ribose 5-phosphate isomerase B [Ignavibacteriaceae bacterium]